MLQPLPPQQQKQKALQVQSEHKPLLGQLQQQKPLPVRQQKLWLQQKQLQVHHSSRHQVQLPLWKERSAHAPAVSTRGHQLAEDAAGPAEALAARQAAGLTGFEHLRQHSGHVELFKSKHATATASGYSAHREKVPGAMPMTESGEGQTECAVTIIRK